MSLDRDPAFALQIHGVEDLRLHLARLKGACNLEKAVGQRRFAVVDVRDDGKVSNVLRIHCQFERKNLCTDELLTASILVYAVEQCLVMADSSLDIELGAMQEIATILHRLDQPTRARVLRWILERFHTDAAFVPTGAPVMPPSAATALRGAPPKAETNDDTLSVDKLDEFFHGDEPEAAPRSAQREAQRVAGLTPEFVAGLQDLSDLWNEPNRGPSVTPGPKPILPIAS